MIIYVRWIIFQPVSQTTLTQFLDRSSPHFKTSASATSVTKEDLVAMFQSQNNRVSTTKKNVSKSKVWNSFSLVSLDGNLTDFLKCDDCMMVYKYVPAAGTKSMHRHINSECKVNSHTLASKPSKPKNDDVSAYGYFKKLVPQSKADEFNRTLVKALAQDLRPLNLTKGNGFRTIAAALINIGATYGNVDVDSLLSHPSTLKRKFLDQVFLDTQDNVKKTVQDCISFPELSFTSDMWTNTFTQDHYLSLTVHFFTAQFELKSYVLSIRHFTQEKKTTENIRRQIEYILVEYFGEEAKLVMSKSYGVTDSGANMLTVFKKQLPCQCHILNLVMEHTFTETNYVRDNLLDVGELLKSTKALVTYFKQSGLNSKLPTTLKQTVSTRWNSNFIMLESLRKAMTEVKILLCERSQLHRLQNINEEHLETLVKF
jgi:hypothetical protein